MQLDAMTYRITQLTQQPIEEVIELAPASSKPGACCVSRLLHRAGRQAEAVQPRVELEHPPESQFTLPRVAKSEGARGARRGGMIRLAVVCEDGMGREFTSQTWARYEFAPISST
jgi:hypothetical protein